MRRPAVRMLAAGAALILVGGLAGCARRSVQAPPEPTAPPATTSREAPAPAEAPSAPGTRVTAEDLAPVFFDFDSWSLREDARTALDRNAVLLRQDPDLQITIEGHCDERGTVEYNQALGERRANAARDYLRSAGVAPSRIQVVSYGKERPFEDGHDETAWARNRRAHLLAR